MSKGKRSRLLCRRPQVYRRPQIGPPVHTVPRARRVTGPPATPRAERDDQAEGEE